MDKKDFDKFSEFVDALSAVKKQEYGKPVTLQDFVSALSYLENGSVQKDVAHRFNPGDWIVYHEWLSDEEPVALKVDTFLNGNYQFSDGSVMEVEKEKFMSPWSIYDAKDKDILLTSDMRPFMFKSIDDVNHISSYCGIDSYGDFRTACDNWTGNKEMITPASKAEKQILFDTMKKNNFIIEDEKKPVEVNYDEFENMLEKDLIKFGDAVTLNRDGFRDLVKKYFELGKFVVLVH